MFNLSSELLREVEASIEGIIYIPAEALRCEYSDLFEEFMSDTRVSKLKDMFGISQSNIERCFECGGSLAETIYRYGYDGFIVKVYFDTYENFAFNADGSFHSCSNGCAVDIEWIYGRTMDEVCYHIKTMAEHKFETEYVKSKNIDVFEMAPKPYQTYPVVVPFSGESVEDLNKNIKTFLEDLMLKINMKIIECPKCHGYACLGVNGTGEHVVINEIKNA